MVGRLRNSHVIPLGARLTAGVYKGCNVTIRDLVVRVSHVRPGHGLTDNSRALSGPGRPSGQGNQSNRAAVVRDDLETGGC